MLALIVICIQLIQLSNCFQIPHLSNFRVTSSLFKLRDTPSDTSSDDIVDAVVVADSTSIVKDYFLSSNLLCDGDNNLSRSEVNEYILKVLS